MSKVLVIANGAAYGNESLFNALRLSITLKEQHPETELNIFFNVRRCDWGFSSSTT